MFAGILFRRLTSLNLMVDKAFFTEIKIVLIGGLVPIALLSELGANITLDTYRRWFEGLLLIFYFLWDAERNNMSKIFYHWVWILIKKWLFHLLWARMAISRNCFSHIILTWLQIMELRLVCSERLFAALTNWCWVNICRECRYDLFIDLEIKPGLLPPLLEVFLKLSNLKESVENIFFSFNVDHKPGFERRRQFIIDFQICELNAYDTFPCKLFKELKSFRYFRCKFSYFFCDNIEMFFELIFGGLNERLLLFGTGDAWIDLVNSFNNLWELFSIDWLTHGDFTIFISQYNERSSALSVVEIPHKPCRE